MSLDPQLLEHSDINSIIAELLIANNELQSFIVKDYENFNVKYSKNNAVFNEIKKSIMNILRFTKQIDKLKDNNYEEVKQLSKKAFELSQNHILSFQKILNDIKKLPNKEQDFINKKLKLEIYEGLQAEGSVLSVISEGLEKYIKEEEMTTDKKVSEKTALVEDLVVGSLIYRKDGSIYYKQKLLKMRYQMRTLCILFMKNHKNFVDYSTIKDELIDAKKRPSTNFKIITKYVSELHNLLREYFKREVIFNQEKDGYIFDTERDS